MTVDGDTILPCMDGQSITALARRIASHVLPLALPIDARTVGYIQAGLVSVYLAGFQAGVSDECRRRRDEGERHD